MSVTSRWPVLVVLLSSSVLLTACYSTQSNDALSFPSTTSELQNSQPSLGDEAGSVNTDIDLSPEANLPGNQDQTLQQYPTQPNINQEESNMDQPQADLPQNIDQLQVQTVTPGTGTTVAAGNTVTAQYKGQLTNGNVFDQGEFSFQVGAGMVIQGWDQGFVGLQEGGQYRLLIPSDMAYGERGAGASIPPNADLVFDVKVVKVQQ